MQTDFAALLAQMAEHVPGMRGEPSADVEAPVEALLSRSRLSFECPEILEIDVHPLLMFERGTAAIDARTVVDSQKT